MEIDGVFLQNSWPQSSLEKVYIDSVIITVRFKAKFSDTATVNDTLGQCCKIKQTAMQLVNVSK